MVVFERLNFLAISVSVEASYSYSAQIWRFLNVISSLDIASWVDLE